MSGRRVLTLAAVALFSAARSALAQRNPEFVAAREGQGSAIRIAAGPATAVTLIALPP